MPAVDAVRAQKSGDGCDGVRLIKVEPPAHRCDVTNFAAYAASSASTLMEALVSSANSKQSQPAATSKTDYAAYKQRVN